MGLEEHIKAGAQLTRDTISFTDPSGIGSVNLGATFSILELQTDTPVRLRLYDRQVSRDDAWEISRPFGMSTSSSIALVGDFSMSAAGIYNIAPAVFGFSQNRQTPETFYRMEDGVGNPIQANIKIKRFLLEDNSIAVDPATFYSVDNRRILPIDVSNQNIPAGGIVSGSLTSAIAGVEIPQTYMLVSASLALNPAHIVRLRLYATSSAIYDETEKARPFHIEASESVVLLVDVLLQNGNETVFFTPKRFAANLENMGNDLTETQLSLAKIVGNKEVYYNLQNIASTSENPEIRVAIYALED